MSSGDESSSGDGSEKYCCGLEFCDNVCNGCCCIECCGYHDQTYCMQDLCTRSECCESAGCQDKCHSCWSVLCCSCLKCAPIEWDYLCDGGLCGVEEEDRYCCQPCNYGCFYLGATFENIRRCMYGRPDAPPKSQKDKGCLCLRPCYSKWGMKFVFMFGVSIMLLSSILDTVTDVLLVYKWFTGNNVLDKVFDAMFPSTKDDDYGALKHTWEAWTLVTFLAVAWGVSAIFSLFWDGRTTNLIGGKSDPALCPSWLKLVLFPFHLIGLGPTVEAIKAWCNHDWELKSIRSNINPFRWIEKSLESGPSALLSLWIISKTNIKVYWDASEQVKEDVRLENFTVFLNLFAMAWGAGQYLTLHIEEDFGRSIHMNTNRPNAMVRCVVAVILIFFDLVARCFIIIMWMTYIPGGLLPIFNFLIIFGSLFLVEVFLVGANGMIAGFIQYPLMAYTSIYHGGLYYFTRKWADDDHKKYTIPLFWTRWTINVGLYCVVYFGFADTNISRWWNYPVIFTLGLMPIVFYLKPSTRTFVETYPRVQKWLDEHHSRVSKMFTRQWFSRTEMSQNPMSPTANTSGIV